MARAPAPLQPLAPFRWRRGTTPLRPATVTGQTAAAAARRAAGEGLSAGIVFQPCKLQSLAAAAWHLAAWRQPPAIFVLLRAVIGGWGHCSPRLDAASPARQPDADPNQALEISVDSPPGVSISRRMSSTAPRGERTTSSGLRSAFRPFGATTVNWGTIIIPPGHSPLVSQ